MTTWIHGPRWQPPARRDRLAIARDVAIIAVCVLILAFALLSLLTSAREAPPSRRASPAAEVHT